MWLLWAPPLLYMGNNHDRKFKNNVSISYTPVTADTNFTLEDRNTKGVKQFLM